jgi:hypothetical protein
MGIDVPKAWSASFKILYAGFPGCSFESVTHEQRAVPHIIPFYLISAALKQSKIFSKFPEGEHFVMNVIIFKLYNIRLEINSLIKNR